MRFDPTRPFQEQLIRKGLLFEAFEFEGGVRVSVQASEFHYSHPRRNLSSASEYTAFEVAVLIGDDFAIPDGSVVWSGFWLGDVAGGVPAEVVQTILRDVANGAGVRSLPGT